MDTLKPLSDEAREYADSACIYAAMARDCAVGTHYHALVAESYLTRRANAHTHAWAARDYAAMAREAGWTR
jgi:hypothetical protein